jgi:hypothetical protein
VIVIELLDPTGHVVLRKRGSGRFPMRIKLSRWRYGIEVTGVRLKSTRLTTLYVDGHPVREHREDWKTPIRLAGGDAIQINAPSTSRRDTVTKVCEMCGERH